MNPIMLSTLAQLSDHDLLARVKHLAGREREVTAVLISHLAELDERRLYLAEGCASLFTYCVQVCISPSTRRMDASRPPGPAESSQ